MAQDFSVMASQQERLLSSVKIRVTISEILSTAMDLLVARAYITSKTEDVDEVERDEVVTLYIPLLERHQREKKDITHIANLLQTLGHVSARSLSPPSENASLSLAIFAPYHKVASETSVSSLICSGLVKCINTCA